MEIEHRQSQLIQELVQQASTLTGSSLASLIVEATSHPSLFSFSEILSLPNLLQLEGTESSAYLSLLRLFAYGTWRDYKSNSGTLPRLIPEQVLKLKQLTVLTLAESNKVLSYDLLLKELEASNVRELEDFLINECMYTAIVKGKLNQVRRCFEVQFAAGRDLMHGQLGSMIDSLEKWQATSDNLLSLIQEKIGWANMMYQKDKNHQKEVEDRIDAVRRGLPFEKSDHKEGNNFWAHDDNFFNYDRSMLHSEDYIRSKRRRSPNFSRQSRAEYF